MAISNLGSISSDCVYYLSNLPLSGETLAAYECQVGMGGKVQICLLLHHVERPA